MPASECQTPPPGTVLVCCGECDRPFAVGHGMFCKRYVASTDQGGGDRMITGFDGTYAGAGTTFDTTDTRRTTKTHGESA